MPRPFGRQRRGAVSRRVHAFATALQAGVSGLYLAASGTFEHRHPSLYTNESDIRRPDAGTKEQSEMNRIKGLALGLGVATLIVAGLACGAEEKQNPTEVGPTSDTPQAQDRPGPSGSPTVDTPPVTGGGTPPASLTYEGVVYYGNPLGREAAEFNEDDLELVGSTTDSNVLAPGDSLDVYMLKGDTDHAYSFEPGWSFQNEDGRTITIEPEWVRWTAADSNQTAPVSSGMLVPRPTTAEELVARAEVVFIGTIISVLDERMMGPYGEDGQPLPAGDDGLPFTDYKVGIAGVLKGDGQVQQDDALVLRMFGHLSNSSEIITPDVFTLPNPGDRLLFALGRNPDGTYGSGPEGLVNISGEKVSYADGVPFGVEISREQFLKDMAVASGAQQATSEVRGPFDTAWAEVTIVSVEDDMATMKIQNLMDYFRYKHATYQELNVGEEILVRYDTSALRSTSGANSVAMGVKEGEAPLETPQTVLIEGENYRADMSVCFSDGVTSCYFEGWSAAIYPLEQSPRSIAPLEESDTKPPPPTTTPLGGARMTAPAPANDEKSLELELFYGQRQDLVGNLGAVLAANEPDTFAGLWIEHQPQFKVVVLFTRDGAETIRRYIADKPVADFVEVGAASVPLVELHNAQADANRAVGDLGIAFGSGTNVKENRIELYVLDAEALYKALRGANRDFPDYVKVVTAAKLDSPG